MSRAGNTKVRITGAFAGRLVIALTLLAGFAAPAAMAAEGERVFDPNLSLIGGCKEEALDPVQDPGCPTNPPEGPHPPALFANPKAVATDFHGNIYVSSYGKKEDGSEGRIDIFSPEGFFISELKIAGPTSLAIDSEGYLYVVAQVEGKRPILRFAPCAPYEPEAGNIEYCNPPVTLAGVAEASSYTGIAINPDNDHLFANFGTVGVFEFASATEGNGKIRTTQAVESWPGLGVAIDAARDRLYASSGFVEERIDIFDLTSVVGTPPEDEYEKVGSIEPSQVPAGDFGTQLSIAVDEATSHVFVLDGENCNLYEFDENDEFVTEIDFPLQCIYAGQIGLDNGPFSPNGVLSEKGRYLYVPSHRTGTGHSFAFFESQVGPPEVISRTATNITEDEAELQAVINPHNLPTTYTLQIKAEGEGTWTLVGEGEIPAGNLDAEVAAVAAGLEEGTAYRFRVFAENEEGTDEAEGSFATYPHTPLEPTPCANALLRTGPSALLPDCRAYELVTPPDTNGRAPFGTSGPLGNFTNRQVSPAGDKVPFKVEGGSLPGLGGLGSFFGDPYLAFRTSSGWTTTYTGPSAVESSSIVAGTPSPDQGHSFWMAEVAGSAVIGGDNTNYVRFPDGHSELVGQGSLGIDPQTSGKLISEGGGHIIFSTGSLASSSTAVQLEPNAAPDETQVLYDRIPDPITGERETKVISLKPGDVPFGAGEHAVFQGASLDGEGVAFEVGGTLYLRYDNTETFAIGTGLEFAGVAEGGDRVFYVEGGDLKAFDAGEEKTITFAETGDADPVQVDLVEGSAAYFASETAIAGSGPNPEGDEPQVGEQNLYLSEEGQISFVGTVTDRDVEGELSGISLDGLGLWVEAIMAPQSGYLANVPARTTPEGSVLLFKSRAALTAYDPDGHAQVYRYDSVVDELHCLSCNPTGAPASSDADLQSRSREGKPLFSSQAWLENLRADGRRAFFESSEALVIGDSDGLQDVYEWEDEGVGSCTRPGGCTYLISSPKSLRNEYLWATTPSGDDAFFLSYEFLVGADADQTPSIYDARVGGGFAEPPSEICPDEGSCRPQPSLPPLLPGVRTPVEGAGDNFKPRRCPKGKRKVKRAGKVICIKKKHRKAAAKQRGARR